MKELSLDLSRLIMVYACSQALSRQTSFSLSFGRILFMGHINVYIILAWQENMQFVKKN